MTKKEKWYPEDFEEKYVKDAKSWADSITKMNGGTPPSDARFEQIAKEMGIKTEKVIKAEKEAKAKEYEQQMDKLVEVFGEEYCRKRYGYQK